MPVREVPEKRHRQSAAGPGRTPERSGGGRAAGSRHERLDHGTDPARQTPLRAGLEPADAPPGRQPHHGANPLRIGRARACLRGRPRRHPGRQRRLLRRQFRRQLLLGGHGDRPRDPVVRGPRLLEPLRRELRAGVRGQPRRFPVPHPGNPLGQRPGVHQRGHLRPRKGPLARGAPEPVVAGEKEPQRDCPQASLSAPPAPTDLASEMDAGSTFRVATTAEKPSIPFTVRKSSPARERTPGTKINPVATRTSAIRELSW